MKSREKRNRGLKRGFLQRDHAHDIVISSSMELWEALDTPISLGLALRAKYGLWREIAEFRISPKDYLSNEGFRKDYLAVSFLRKYPGLDFRVDRKANAMEKFIECEEECRFTNVLLRGYRRGLVRPTSIQVEQAISLAQSKIVSTLGAFDLTEMSEGFRWGPGNTSANSAGAVSAYNKFDIAPEATAMSLPYAWAAINSIPTWASHLAGSDYPASLLPREVSIVHGNRVTTVPKDALIDRVIAIEPHMNIYMQLGLGGVIRSRLRRVGVDLNKGQFRNAEMARKGARDGTLATIDLSSASDLISEEVVRLLLPEEWFKHLNALRSHRYRLDSDESSPIRTYEKFSSMGNGFTFELETLIFWAIAKSCLSVLRVSDEGLCVYGDDIIIPVIAYDLYVQVLHFLGFKVNSRKSFKTGLFRESCGEHFFGRLNVKPVYWDSIPETVPEIYAMANQITYLAERWGSVDAPDVRFRSTRDLIISKLRRSDRLFGPRGVGDSFLIGNFEECSKTLQRAPYGWEGFTSLGLVGVPVKRSMSSAAALTMGLYEIRKAYRPSRSNGVLRRSDVRSLVSLNKRLGFKLDLGELLPHPLLESPSQGTYVLRGRTRYFKTFRLLVPAASFVGVWQ